MAFLLPEPTAALHNSLKCLILMGKWRRFEICYFPGNDTINSEAESQSGI